MQENNGLTFAYRLDAGTPVELAWTDIENLNNGEIAWIHLNRSSGRTQAWLRDHSGLEPHTIDALLDSATRPRAVFMDKGVLVTLRGVNLNPGADPEDMVSIRIWLDASRIVTLHRERIMAAEDVADAIRQKKKPTSTSDVFVRLATCLVERMAPTIDTVNDELDELEEKIIDSNRDVGQDDIAPLRTQILALKRYLSPQREAMSMLHRETHEILSSTHRTHLREASNRIVRYVEDLDAARERATIIQDELVREQAEKLNARMYVVTVIAAVFLPLTFITGLLGTNVGGIPGANHPLGFIIETAILVSVTLGTIMILRWKKWL